MAKAALMFGPEPPSGKKSVQILLENLRSRVRSPSYTSQSLDHCQEVVKYHLRLDHTCRYSFLQPTKDNKDETQTAGQP